MRNREGWEVKMLGEVCEVSNGFAFKSNLFKSDGSPIIRISNIQDDKVYLDDVVFFDKSDYKIDLEKFMITKGDILIAMSGATTGKIGLYQQEKASYLNQRVGCIRTTEFVDKKFIFYYLKTLVEEILRLASGVAQPNISTSQLKSFRIPLPPLPTQHQIVAELDTLNSIIDKKKEQLNELDNLAQATFYDMFGDPVENEKGWEKKKLKETADLINGRAYKRDELLDKGKTPVLRVGNFFTSNKFYYSDLELPPDKYCDFGDLLFAWSASFGAKIWDGGKVIFHYHIWKVDYKEEIYNKYFLLNLLNIVTHSLMNQMRGGIMLHLTKGGMEKTDFITPPLSLQTQFAQKIEQIENKKSLIQRSIDDVQQLFDYTMDKYFN